VQRGFKALGRFSPGLHPAAAVRGPGVPGWPALYERFTVTYPGGTFIESFYGDGATLGEVRVTPPLALVECRRGFTGERRGGQDMNGIHAAGASKDAEARTRSGPRR